MRRRASPQLRHSSLASLKSLVDNHHTYSAQEEGKDFHLHNNGRSASNDNQNRPMSPFDVSRPSSPTSDQQQHQTEGGSHHHQHSANDERTNVSLEETDRLKLKRAIHHLQQTWTAMALRKWHEFIELQIWNNLGLKARNICVETELCAMSKKNLDIAVEWVGGVCSSIFENASKQELREIVQGSSYHELSDGEPLFFQGDPGKNYWIVLHGEIRICVLESNAVALRKSAMYKRRKSWLDSNENEPFHVDLGHTVWTAGPGIGFGQIALISKTPMRTGSCIAARDGTSCLAVPKEIYIRYLQHLHEAEKGLDERVEFLGEMDHFQSWNRTRLVHLGFAMREKTYSRGATIMDGRNAEKGDTQLDVLIIKDGLVEYSRYLPSVNHPQSLAICGVGRMFGVPGGSICDPEMSKDMLMKALRETKVYIIPKGYFVTATNKSRADMQSARQLFKREEKIYSAVQKKRVQKISRGIQAEAEMLRMRLMPISAPKLSDMDTSTLGPHPNEGLFAEAPALTLDRLIHHSTRSLTHVAELKELAYKDVSQAPPWGAGTPLDLLSQEIRKKKKIKKSDTLKDNRPANNPNEMLPSISKGEKQKKKKKKKKTGGRLGAHQMEEPAIVVKTKEMFKHFRTRDSTNILMGLKM